MLNGIIFVRCMMFLGTYYKWKNKYEKKGIVGLSDTSRRPHSIKHMKVTPEVEERIILLKHNDKPIPKSYPQLQGKVEAYNKIVKNEFLAIEDISIINDGKLRYEMFVKAYNKIRVHTAWWNKRSYSIRNVSAKIN